MKADRYADERPLEDGRVAGIDALVSDHELAAWTGVSARTVRDWSRTGVLPAPVIERKGCWRWHPDDVRRWANRRRR